MPADPAPLSTGFIAQVDRWDQRVDQAWDQALRGRPLLDKAYYLASQLGDFSLIWLLVGAAQGLRSDEHADAAGRLAVVLLGESLLVNQGIKRLIPRARPVATEPRPHALRTPQTTSFPSGHASAAFTAAGLLADTDPKLAPAYYALAAFVATSRIHVKIHHASDVVAGAAIGIGLAAAVTRLWPLPGGRSRRG